MAKVTSASKIRYKALKRGSFHRWTKTRSGRRRKGKLRKTTMVKTFWMHLNPGNRSFLRLLIRIYKKNWKFSKALSQKFHHKSKKLHWIKRTKFKRIRGPTLYKSTKNPIFQIWKIQVCLEHRKKWSPRKCCKKKEKL